MNSKNCSILYPLIVRKVFKIALYLIKEQEFCLTKWHPLYCGSVQYRQGERCMDLFMKCAIEEAEAGLMEGGIPIGSVLVRDGKILAKGRNRRVQEDDPLLHAEIDCLRNAGRLRTYAGCTLYSTLMPCYLCAGAVVQFGIGKVMSGESENFPGAREFMKIHGVEVIDLDLEVCKRMMHRFIEENPELWYEDIGALQAARGEAARL
jgi:cytosine/creatinine deaminase